MIRLPRYGKNIRRYADAAFDAAWREVVTIGIPGVREYLSSSNPECAVPFNVHLKFGGSGLIGATVERIEPKGEFELIAAHIYPLWEIDYQRREWHSQIYRAAALRYTVERYGRGGSRRPFYALSDEEVDRSLNSPSNAGDDFVADVGFYARSLIARWELDHRARESNHAKLERLAAMKESA
ncbi:hypothetical protein [Sagittula sp. MA-2]|jgi:hypothetical protein|uniref:hypothetical protein n=1 Tax=Sagittula sp. MA-2 TaxID=3048007 RepID=UPI0024C25282|nr:hypothetical protein [Sagittula sp. MA-2]WHZ36528.1 hypothetical protein QNI11_05820 [Sagittula sp. MA-2]